MSLGEHKSSAKNSNKFSNFSREGKKRIENEEFQRLKSVERQRSTGEIFVKLKQEKEKTN